MQDWEGDGKAAIQTGTLFMVAFEYLGNEKGFSGIIKTKKFVSEA